MEEPTHDDWIKAGKIAAEALWYGKTLIKPGVSLLEVSDKVEQKIAELGGKLAFPTQISCDNIAAHYCADPKDDIVFELGTGLGINDQQVQLLELHGGAYQ